MRAGASLVSGGRARSTVPPSDRFDPEDRVIGRIRQFPELLLDLVSPTRQVGVDHGRLLLVGYLGGSEPLRARPTAQLTSSRRAQISHPVGISTGSHQIPP